MPSNRLNSALYICSTQKKLPLPGLTQILSFLADNMSDDNGHGEELYFRKKGSDGTSR